MTTSSSEIINVRQLIRIHSFQFSLSMSKDIIEELIPIIMSNLSVIVFGYRKNEDKYWGKMSLRKDKQETTFTMTFTRIKEKETTCVISVFNASDINSQTIAENIFTPFLI